MKLVKALFSKSSPAPKVHLPSTILFLVIAGISTAYSATIVSDTFSDGSVSKTGSFDLTYYSSAAGNISVIADSTLDTNSAGSYYVMKLSADRSAISPLGQTISLTESSPIAMSFNFRYTVSTGSTLRIGLFYDYGTTVTGSSDFSTQSTDDQGIFMSLTATSIQGVAESGGSSGGGIMAGSDRTYGSSTPYTLDTTPHSATITYSLSGTTVTATFVIDGISYGSVSATGMTTTFNEFAMTSLGNAFEIDNLTIATIPEPSTWALILVGLSSLGAVRIAKTSRRNASAI